LSSSHRDPQPSLQLFSFHKNIERFRDVFGEEAGDGGGDDDLVEDATAMATTHEKQEGRRRSRQQK
jgi:hypothetical protein